MKTIPTYHPTENWVIPPENQGQIVTVSYSLDADAGVILERTYDASDQSEGVVAYHYPRNDDGAWDPWNGTPRLGRCIGKCRIGE